MRGLLLAVTVASLASFGNVRAQAPPPGVGRQLFAGSPQYPLLPSAFETELALSAAPKQLREQATVWTLEKGGYTAAKKGTNAFTCIVSRRAGDLFPVCWDAEGTQSLLPLDVDDARLRLSGKSGAEIESIVAQRFKAGQYHAPSRAGIAYMLSPARYRIDEQGRVTRTASNPHLMFYGPNLTDSDIGGGRESFVFINRVGPDGMMIVPVGQKERDAIVTESQSLIERLEQAIGYHSDGAAAGGQPQTAPTEPDTRLADVPRSLDATITVERRDDVVLIGLNRPFIQNRLDPPTRVRLAQVFYQYEHDPSLRAAVLFGHGADFSRGIDVDASQAALISGSRAAARTDVVDPLGNSQPRRSKPLVVVVQGDTWNLGHELYLAGDVRIAAANTRFGQDENTHGRFPGGGATVRFVRDAGWGNAMRYMLTGDHWTAEESYRMGITQGIAPTPAAALEAGVAMARKIAACAPLSIKATLASARQMIDPVEADALSKLGPQYAALYRTEDFLEGRRAEAEGRRPKYQGK